jgi:hypothetical protein
MFVPRIFACWGRAGLGLSESEAELEIASDAPGGRAFSA